MYPFSLYTKIMLSQIQPDCSSFSRNRFDADPVPEIIRDPPAQVKAYPACSLILASVESGISVFKYTRQVFRAYANAGILNA